MSAVTQQPLTPVVEAEIRPRQPEQLAVQQPAGGLVALVERLVLDPAVDVTKLEKMIELQERMIAHGAKASFNAAFAAMQPQIPEITERGQIKVRGELRSTFAPLEDIHEVVKPICAEYGFAIRHRTEWPPEKPGIIRIVGILSHRDGHSEETIFEAPADSSDYRTDVQSMGSTISYGRRYTTLDLLNISTRGQDRDGQARQHADGKAPDGYQDWRQTLIDKAEEGWPALQQVWATASGDKALKPFADHLTKTEPKLFTELKAKAAKVRK